MYSIICKYISSKFLKKQMIHAEEQEVFEFGLETIISTVFALSLLMITGLILNKIIESIIFYICFKYSRKQAGGYHADTYTKCNIYYILTFVICAVLSGYLSQTMYSNIIFVFIIIFTLATIILLAPINNPNNPILPGFENIFFLKAIVVNSLMIIVAIILKVMKYNIWAFLALTLFSSAIYMHIEIIKRREWSIKKITKNFGEKIANFIMKKAEGTTREVSSGRIYQAKRPEALNHKVEDKNII